jgi:predicted RNase H-like HicB family nuclease
MTVSETVLVVTPLRVRFVIERDPSGLYVGHVREYPGILTQGRTRESVRRGLIRLLREISREHPRELALFR